MTAPHARHPPHHLFAALLALIAQLINLVPRQHNANLHQPLAAPTLRGEPPPPSSRTPSGSAVGRSRQTGDISAASPVDNYWAPKGQRRVHSISCVLGSRVSSLVGQMLCVACGQKMRLVLAVPDDTMFVPGYEHHIIECLGCGETERRLVFRQVGEHWTDATPTTQPKNGCDDAPCADAPKTAVVEPTASRLTVQRGLLAEPGRSSGSWERRIENVRARLDDLRKRAELANREARAVQEVEEGRRRFTVFWEDLAAHKASSQPEQPAAGRWAPLPRSAL